MGKKMPVGFREFLVKSGVFVVLFVLIQLLTMGLVAKTSLPGGLKLVAMDDLAEAVLFVLVIFIGFNRKRILKIKSYVVSVWVRILSFCCVFLGFFVYFSYKNFLMNNLELAGRFIYLFTIIEFLMLFVVLFFLIVLVFGFRFCRDFFRENGLGLFYSLIGVVSVYFGVRVFQDLWGYIGGFVAESVRYLLSFFGNSSFYYANGLPILVFNNFSVGVAKTCSGIDSVLLFTGLYLGILAWDWGILDKRKAFGMYFVGVLGAFALNIVRIFLLILIGFFVSRDFALHSFHTNASSLLFIIYFGVFWKSFYGWMRKRD